MKKFKHLHLFALSVATLSFGCLSIPLVSCSDSDDLIDIYEDSIYVDEKDCSFYFQTKLEENTKIHVDFTNFTPSDLSIVNKDLVVNREENKIDLKISDIIKANTTFEFQLEFSFPKSATTKNVTTKTLHINYTYKDDDDDDIRAIQTNVAKTNSYIFDFSFMFQHQPQSPVTVELINDYSNKLSLESWGNKQTSLTVLKIYEAHERDYRYYVDIPLYLQVSIFKSQTLNFNLKFTFTNSKGNLQTTTISNLSVSLDFHTNREIPIDFLNIEEDDNNQKHLHGFKNKIPYDVIELFPTLRIPNFVNYVDEIRLYDSWNTKFYFNKIIFETNDKQLTIGEMSLYYCHNVSILDFSQFNPANLVNFAEGTIFHNDMFEHGGVVIVPTCDPIAEIGYEDWQILFENQGFIKDKAWEIYESKLVLPDEYYQKVYNEDLGAYILKDIDGKDLSDYAIINMPDDILTIEKDAFNKLKQNPFIPEARRPTIYGNRFLSFSSILKTLQGESALSKMGLTGLINIPRCVEELPKKCFERADDIDSTGTFSKKQLTFNFNKNSSLKIINESAFANNDSITKVWIPKSIETVEAAMFDSCKNVSYLNFVDCGNASVPNWKSSTGATDLTYFTDVGTSVSPSITKVIQIAPVSSYLQETWINNWKVWLGQHGLFVDENNWTFILAW